MRKFSITCIPAVLISCFGATTSSAQSTVSISLAGEAYDGPPAFKILAGNRVIGAGVLQNPLETRTEGRLFANARPSRYLETFSFEVADETVLPDQKISVQLTNDKFAEGDAGLDRNLFIDTIEVNGHELTSADLVLLEEGVPRQLDYQAGMLPIYQSGQTAIAHPPPGGWPATAPMPAAHLTDIPFPTPRPAWWSARATQ